MIEPVQVDPKAIEFELKIPVEKIEATLAALKEGRPASFIARYRKDITKLDKDDDVMKIAALYDKRRRFADRKYSYLKTIELQGKLTDELKTLILDARSPHRLDDLVAPFKSREAGPAQDARDKGLEPLADAIMTATDSSASLEALAAQYVSDEKGVATAQDAINGAAAIIVERFADNFKIRQTIRAYMNRDGVVVTKPAENPEPVAEPANSAPAPETNAEGNEKGQDAPTEGADEKERGAKSRRADRKKSESNAREDLMKTVKDLVDKTFDVREVARSRNRIIALERAESEKLITVTVDGDHAVVKELARQAAANSGPFTEFLNNLVDVAAETRVLAVVASDIRRDFEERVAEQERSAIVGYVRNRLMRRPVVGRRALAVDTSRRGENVVVALDQFGNFLDSVSVHFSGSEDRVADAAKKVAALVERYNLSVFAIRDSVSYRKAEEFFIRLIQNELAGKDVGYVRVSDLGVEEYVATPDSQLESPNLDIRTRAALSIGRRLLDPLAEYVKVAPEKLVDETTRRKSRGKSPRELVSKVISQCVDQTVVDVNRASLQTLRYVAGLNPIVAKNIVDYRREHGAFRTREEIKNVLGVSDSTFLNCAGFLKVFDGPNPLDATWIHPESYDLATAILAKFGFAPSDLRSPEKAAALSVAIKTAKASEIAAEFNAGERLVEDILAELACPCRDARQNEPTPIFKKKMIPIEDVRPGSQLVGEVVCVVDFGAFVDIGATTPGLVHHSQLPQPSHDARRAVSLGDVVTVWALSVDVERGRISLTMIDPSAPRDDRGDSQEPRRTRRPRRDSDTRRNDGEQGERRPRRDNRDGGDRRERGARGDSDERAERRGRDGGRRDRDRDRDRPPRVAQVAPKAKETKPLSEEKKSGKAQLQSFEELKQFIEQQQQGR